MTLVVERPGPASLVQDLGRPGRGHLGVSPSGAFDRRAMWQANAVLGNAPGAAVIETHGDLVLVSTRPHVVSVTGGVGPVTVDGRPVTFGRATPVAAGERLVLGRPAAGVRTYVGVRGGFDVLVELGSASTDTLSGLGPPPLTSGLVLATGPAGPAAATEDVLPIERWGEVTLDVVLGPRDDWFAAASVRRLLDQPWRVSPVADRVGVRLDGAMLERVVHHELPSEPVVRGSIQVSSAGQPMVFGPDHPVTGGYPVIAVVVDAHTDRLAQARPGDVVRFRRRAS